MGHEKDRHGRPRGAGPEAGSEVREHDREDQRSEADPLHHRPARREQRQRQEGRRDDHRGRQQCAVLPGDGTDPAPGQGGDRHRRGGEPGGEEEPGRAKELERRQRIELRGERKGLLGGLLGQQPHDLHTREDAGIQRMGPEGPTDHGAGEDRGDCSGRRDASPLVGSEKCGLHGPDDTVCDRDPRRQPEHAEVQPRDGRARDQGVPPLAPDEEG